MNLNTLLSQIKPSQGQNILGIISQIQGGSGLGLLLKDPEILDLLKKLGDPKEGMDPSSISEGKKIVICEALETLMEDNPSILEVFGIKADSFNFCDLRY